MPMERMRVLAACLALREFTISEVIAYSGANENTVRSVLRRDSELFEELPERRGTGTHRPGRRAGRWRLVDPSKIRRLATDLQGELAGIQPEIASAVQPDEATYDDRLAAVTVAEHALLRAWEEPNPELRHVLSEIALNNLAEASPPSAGDKVGSEEGGRPDYAPNANDISGLSSSEEEILPIRIRAVAVLATLIEAESAGSVISSAQLAEAAIAISRLESTPSEADLQTFFRRLADLALDDRLPGGAAAVFGKIVTAKSPVSVSDVAERTGLRHGEVERALRPLLHRKYVVSDYGEGSSGLEQPTSPVRVNEDQHRVIGISVLPEKVIGVLTNLRVSSSIVRHRQLENPEKGQIDEDVLVEAVSSLVDEFREIRSDIIGLGVELPGHVNGRMGEVIFSPVLSQKNILLKEKLERATGLHRVVVENDANALAIHEQWFGDGTDRSDFAVILLPERGGVGSGIVSNDQIVYGSKGAAGELGHLEYKPGGRECYCNNRGCLETVAGVAGILEEIRDNGHSAVDLATAAALAEKDQVVRESFQRAGKALGWGISVVLNLFNPELVIVFGPDQLVEPEQFTAAKSFMGAMERASRERGFPMTEQYKLIWGHLRYEPMPPYDPVWRGAIAASAVLGRFIRRPLD